MIHENCPQAPIHLLGLRSDIPRLTAALHIACLSSHYGEGFPNVVGEAMACGIPCVVTDVGDSAHIVNDTGMVVAPGDYSAMADAWRRLLDMSADDRRVLGLAGRERIAALFSMGDIVSRFEGLYAEIGRGA